MVDGAKRWAWGQNRSLRGGDKSANCERGGAVAKASANGSAFQAEESSAAAASGMTGGWAGSRGFAGRRRSGCLGRVGNIRLGAEQGWGLTSLGFNRPVLAASSEGPATVIISRSAASQGANWESGALQQPPAERVSGGEEKVRARNRPFLEKRHQHFIVTSVQGLVFAHSRQAGCLGAALERCLRLMGSLRQRVAMESELLTWA